MENQTKNLIKDAKTAAQPKSLNKKHLNKNKHWTLLFIGDKGEVITIKKFKAVVITSAVTVVIAVAAIVFSFFVYKSVKKENIYLQNILSDLQHQVLSLKDEKDALLIGLVAVESKKKAGLNETADSDEQDKHPELKKKETRKIEVVSVENLSVFHDSGTDTFKIQLKIINTSLNLQPLSGNTFVILKNDGGDKKNWLTFPRVPLVSDKPSQIKKGRQFSITRFNIIKFKEKVKADPKMYNNATVFIFSKTGELLLEKNFKVKVEPKPVSSEAD